MMTIMMLTNNYDDDDGDCYDCDFNVNNTDGDVNDNDYDHKLLSVFLCSITLRIMRN